MIHPEGLIPDHGLDGWQPETGGPDGFPDGQDQFMLEPGQPIPHEAPYLPDQPVIPTHFTDEALISLHQAGELGLYFDHFAPVVVNNPDGQSSMFTEVKGAPPSLAQLSERYGAYPASDYSRLGLAVGALGASAGRTINRYDNWVDCATSHIPSEPVQKAARVALKVGGRVIWLGVLAGCSPAVQEITLTPSPDLGLTQPGPELTPSPDGGNAELVSPTQGLAIHDQLVSLGIQDKCSIPVSDNAKFTPEQQEANRALLTQVGTMLEGSPPPELDSFTCVVKPNDAGDPTFHMYFIGKNGDYYVPSVDGSWLKAQLENGIPVPEEYIPVTVESIQTLLDAQAQHALDWGKPLEGDEAQNIQNDVYVSLRAQLARQGITRETIDSKMQSIEVRVSQFGSGNTYRIGVEVIDGSTGRHLAQFDDNGFLLDNPYGLFDPDKSPDELEWGVVPAVPLSPDGLRIELVAYEGNLRLVWARDGGQPETDDDKVEAMWDSLASSVQLPPDVAAGGEAISPEKFSAVALDSARFVADQSLMDANLQLRFSEAAQAFPPQWSGGIPAYSLELNKIVYVDANGEIVGLYSVGEDLVGETEGWVKVYGSGNIYLITSNPTQTSFALFMKENGQRVEDSDGDKVVLESLRALFFVHYAAQNGIPIPEGATAENYFTEGDGKAYFEPGRNYILQIGSINYNLSTPLYLISGKDKVQQQPGTVKSDTTIFTDLEGKGLSIVMRDQYDIGGVQNLFRGMIVDLTRQDGFPTHDSPYGPFENRIFGGFIWINPNGDRIAPDNQRIGSQ